MGDLLNRARSFTVKGDASKVADTSSSERNCFEPNTHLEEVSPVTPEREGLI
jgi:hypothetical protein